MIREDNKYPLFHFSSADDRFHLNLSKIQVSIIRFMWKQMHLHVHQHQGRLRYQCTVFCFYQDTVPYMVEEHLVVW